MQENHFPFDDEQTENVEEPVIPEALDLESDPVFAQFLEPRGDEAAAPAEMPDELPVDIADAAVPEAPDLDSDPVLSQFLEPQDSGAAEDAFFPDVLSDFPVSEAPQFPAEEESPAQAPAAPREHCLEDPVTAEEILPDEAAIAAAGLTHPSDVEFEKIMAEALSEDWAPTMSEPSAAEQPPAEVYKDQEYGDSTTDFDIEDDPENPQLPVEPEDDEEEEEPDEPVEKRRPRMKKGYGLLGLPHVLATVVWLAVVLIVGVSLAKMLWRCVDDVMAFSRGDQEVVITIEDSDTIDTIAEKLHNAGLINYPGLFKLYASFTDAREDISSGTFTLNTMYDYHALVGFMTTYSAYRTVVKVQIPEGYTCAQIFQLMEEKDVCPAADLEAYAASGELDDYWFLTGIKRGTPNCLEGFLFPDTYEFYTKEEPRRVLEKLLDNFDYRFNQSMIDTIPLLNERLGEMMKKNGYDDEYITAHAMDIQKIITVASLIERESSGSLESYNISSVIYNRLTNAGNYPYLNIDAALYYALEEGHGALTYDDLAIDSPYNTYKYPGLIPGPIANPGLDSILAALDPETTDFYFYALNPETGTHHFSKNASEHEKFLASVSKGD